MNILNDANLILHNPKSFCASLVALGSLVADAVTDLKGWEDISLKAILLAAVIYLVRQQTREREEHKVEATQREEKNRATIQSNTDTLAEVVQVTREQTGYLRDVVKTIVDKELKRQ